MRCQVSAFLRVDGRLWVATMTASTVRTSAQTRTSSTLFKGQTEPGRSTVGFAAAGNYEGCSGFLRPVRRGR